MDGTSRKFRLRVKEVLTKIGLKVIEGDEAFYYLYENGVIKGAVNTQVDDFNH